MRPVKSSSSAEKRNSMPRSVMRFWKVCEVDVARAFVEQAGGELRDAFLARPDRSPIRP